MKTRTIVTVMAATLLSVCLVPVSIAQDSNNNTQNGIEVITILGKRPAPIVTTGLLSKGLVPVSTAQDNNGGAPDGIEVITIVGKRPATTMASACVNEVIARKAGAAELQKGDGNFSEEAQESDRTNMASLRKDIKRCFDQASAQI